MFISFHILHVATSTHSFAYIGTLLTIWFIFQSPEAYFAHTPGLKVVIPRSPAKAKATHSPLSQKNVDKTSVFRSEVFVSEPGFSYPGLGLFGLDILRRNQNFLKTCSRHFDPLINRENLWSWIICHTGTIPLKYSHRESFCFTSVRFCRVSNRCFYFKLRSKSSNQPSYRIKKMVENYFFHLGLIIILHQRQKSLHLLRAKNSLQICC
jgi:hypothetical protein